MKDNHTDINNTLLTVDENGGIILQSDFGVSGEPKNTIVLDKADFNRVALFVNERREKTERLEWVLTLG